MAARKKRDSPAPPGRLDLAAMGLEAEFALMLDNEQKRPEELFASPRDFIRGELMHRQGTSYHLPTGGAVYFDTGVIEVATPVIEIEPGCAVRAGRSLWDAIQFIRNELDAWDERSAHDTRLVGFSAHYNVSFELPMGESANGRSIEQLARLLIFVLPAPVMLLATNRRSTGVGVRPRSDRIEVTVDFTPDAPMMIAAATLIVGVVREVLGWPSYEPSQLDEHGIPVIAGFSPMPHTSRKGWLAGHDCYPHNPFTCDIDEAMWPTLHHGVMSLRAIAAATIDHFRPSIRKLADASTLHRIDAVLRGRAPSLLDLADRPHEYDDVGRSCTWEDRYLPARLARSRYERVMMMAVSGRELRVDGRSLHPVGMSGWSAVVFRDDHDRRRTVVRIDDLLEHLEDWERSTELQLK